MSLFFMLPSSPAGTVTLGGETVTETEDFIGNGYAGIRVNTDGTIDKITGDSGAGGPDYTPIDVASDWITPNSAAGSRTFHFRLNTNSGDALDGGSSSAGTWIELTGNISFFVLVANGTGDSKDHNADLLVSTDGGATTLVTSAAPYIFDLDDL
jgi:hypothetical protein